MTQTIEQSLPNGSASDVAFSPIAPLMEAQRVRVHRLVTRQIASDRYLVGRAGVRGAITTSALGVAAIRLLRTGSPPREIQLLLGRSSDATVEMSGLLSALLRAGFIRKADSTRFNTRRIGVWAQARAYMRPRLNLAARLTDFLATSVPPAWGLRILRAIRYRAISTSAPFSAEVLARRISVDGSPVPLEICRNHQRELSDQDSLTRIIIQSEPRRLDSWIRQNVSLVGRQNLVDSLATGRGTIVAAFHYGAFPLMPVCLAANGFALTMPHFGVQFGGIPHERVFDAHVDACGWAPVVVHRKGSLAAIAQIVRTLRAGGVACISVDYCNPFVRDEHSEQRNRSGRPAQIEVAVAGRRIMVENWVGWLAAASNASVLPSMSYRKTSGRYAVELRPALEFANSNELSSGEWSSAITLRVVAALEPDVAADPLKWAFLSTFTQATGGAS